MQWLCDPLVSFTAMNTVIGVAAFTWPGALDWRMR